MVNGEKNLESYLSKSRCGVQCDIILRPMTEVDLEQVVGIEILAFPHPWTEEHFRDELRSPYGFPFVAVDDLGVVAGYLCPALLLDEGEILDVAVNGAFRNRGIGRLLVESALDFFRERGANRVYLEVRVSNQSAISLYRSLGFRDAGCRKRYYENGEDALLMEISFNGAAYAV